MFTPHFFIDTFQSTKKLVTDQVFKDPALNKAAHAYICLLYTSPSPRDRG